jgi:hypothetical protein
VFHVQRGEAANTPFNFLLPRLAPLRLGVSVEQIR